MSFGLSYGIKIWVFLVFLLLSFLMHLRIFYLPYSFFRFIISLAPSITSAHSFKCYDLTYECVILLSVSSAP